MGGPGLRCAHAGRASWRYKVSIYDRPASLAVSGFEDDGAEKFPNPGSRHGLTHRHELMPIPSFGLIVFARTISFFRTLIRHNNMAITSCIRPTACAVLLALGASSALATNGYFAHGYGVKSQGMAGAATALAQDGFAGANNPAAAAFAGDRLDVGASLFNPERSASRTGGASADSGHELFLIPEFGYNRSLDDQTAVGLTVYGNGGMNTSYPADQNLLNGSGKLGVDLNQLIVAPTLAYQLNERHAVGVSPRLVYQRFAARGLQAFANMPGMSSDPAHVTNQGYDSSTGVGLRLGYQGQIGESVRVGAAWSPRVEMGRFEQYQGLFAGQGGFDLPENINLGVAWQASPALLLALDYQRINYSGVASVGGASQVPAQLGSANGPGFGWRDIEVWKLGAQWQYNADWTLRAGVNRSQNPVTPQDVTFNILAPGVMTTHWTLGASYRLSASDELSFSYMRAPEQSVSGVSMFDSKAFGGPGNESVRETIRMKQQLLGVQFSRRF